jgi:hypothetical protein
MKEDNSPEAPEIQSKFSELLSRKVSFCGRGSSFEFMLFLKLESPYSLEI